VRLCFRDLLFAFIVCDVSVSTWGCSNGVGSWNLLFQRNNTVGFAVFWKYAAASGEGPIVVTASTNDTYCGWCCSVQDVFQGYTSGSPPLNTNVAQSSSTRFNGPTLVAQAGSLILQTFANSSNNPGVFGVR